jgi:hypothetical protein
MGDESGDKPFFLILVGRWLLLALGAKAAASSKVTVKTATASNDRIIFRMESILSSAVLRGLSMVVDAQFCEITIVLTKNIFNLLLSWHSSFETEKEREDTFSLVGMEL